MKFFLLLGLAVVAGPFAVEGRTEARDPLFSLDGPALESPVPAEEDAWSPFPYLRYDDWGAPLTERRAVEGLHAGWGGESFDWREASLPERSALHRLLEPLDALVGLEHVRGSWDRAASEGSVTTDLTSWANSLGAPLSGRAFLGICVDLLSYEECDGGRLPLIDAKHGSARPNYLTTGVGLTLGF
jgi:hypothetical protein